MIQNDVFFESEGDHWFKRNVTVSTARKDPDWPCGIADRLEFKKPVRYIAEADGANGYRLVRLSTGFESPECVGIDASHEAIDAARRSYLHPELHRARLTGCSLKRTFDLVIVSFVFHWIDRSASPTRSPGLMRLSPIAGICSLQVFCPIHRKSVSVNTDTTWRCIDIRKTTRRCSPVYTRIEKSRT